MRKVLIAMLLSLLVVGCTERGANDKGEQARRDTLAAVDDSIRQLSPHVRSLIEQRLRTATDSTTYYEYLLRLSSYYLLTATPDSMLPYTAAVIRYAEAQSAPTPRLYALLAQAYENEASYRQNHHKDLPQALVWHRRAYGALLKSDIKDFLPDLMSNIADAHILNNELPEAAAAYRRALFLNDSLQLPEVKTISLYMSLASIYLNLGDYNEAHRLYDLSYRHIGELSPKMQQMLVNNYGNYFYYRRQYPEALQKFLELKRIVHRNDGDDGFYMNLCNINLADVYLNLDSLQQAQACIDRAEPYFRKNAIDVGIYYATTIRMGLAVKHHRFDEVERLLAAEHITSDVDHSMKRIRNQYLREYYLARGNARAAYDNKMREDRLEDSLAEQRAYMRASEVIQRFTEDTLALHHQVRLAGQQQETRQARGVAVGLVACVVILLLILAFWWQRSRRRRTESEMALLKQRMENARNRMSPHFVFNVLNHGMANTSPEEQEELMRLAKLIRRSLDMSHNVSTLLRDELAFVRDYVELQRHVLRPDFDFQVNVSTESLLDEVRVPSMFVQILVENCIKHGLKGLERPQRLSIDITGQADDLVITVADNGRGYMAAGRKGTGLLTMLQTIDTLNMRNRRHPMDIDIRNVRSEAGDVAGCATTLTIPRRYKYN